MSDEIRNTIKTDRSLSKEVFTYSYIFKSFYSALCAFAARIIKHYHAAEDLVSDIFVRVLEQSIDFESPDNAKNWLYRSTRNACINYYKRNRYLHVSDNLLESLLKHQHGVTAMSKETAFVEIKKAIKLLPKERRRVFILYYIKGVGNEAIAEKLRISVQTVKNQKSTALTFIRTRLKNYHLSH